MDCFTIGTSPKGSGSKARISFRQRAHHRHKADGVAETPNLTHYSPKENAMSESKRRAPCKRYMQVFTQVIIEGRKLRDVAKSLRLKQKSILDIVSRVRVYLRKQGASLYLPNPGRMRAIHVRELYLARLEHQWEELMQEWYRSKRPARADKVGSVEVEGGKKQKRGEHQRKTQTGDVKYLKDARAILREIRELCMNRPYATKEQNYVKLLTLKQREDAFDRIVAEISDGSAATTDAGDGLGGADSARAA
jgi:hypothetical protein